MLAVGVANCYCEDINHRIRITGIVRELSSTRCGSTQQLVRMLGTLSRDFGEGSDYY